MTNPDQNPELRELLELYCENKISQQQLTRLEELATSDRQSTQFYMDYIELHGNLLWDLASHSGKSAPPVGQTRESTSNVPTEPLRSRVGLLSAMAACLAFAAVATFVMRNKPADDGPVSVTTSEEADQDEAPSPKPRSVQPLELGPAVAQNTEQVEDELTPPTPETESNIGSLTDAEILARINNDIQQSWQDAAIEASSEVDNNVWARRAFLNIVGRIPTSDEVENAKSLRSRAALVKNLLDDSGYARYWSGTWTNLLIGRSSERGVNRPGFEKFLRDRFASNAPWNETVSELIAAEGTTDDNGATNFLVAHLNSQAVPATAVTARVFLGIQVQCTQCHDHPFDKTRKQDQFWSLNSFFKQTKMRERGTGSNTNPQYLLTSTNQSGPTHYETRGGLMQTAFPKYGEREIDPGPQTNRRAELARIVTQQDSQQLARAMVNRVWAHFFGFGFTNPIDDMGQHNQASHPELLEFLAGQFRQSGFDLKRLVTWIVLSAPYSLDSKFNENGIDSPARGEVPLFSRMYVRSMSPEQVYDSLVVATKSHERPGFDWNNALRSRHQWIQQFMFAHRNEENSEASTFNGSITQALSLMNSQLVNEATSTERGTLLASIINEHQKPAAQVTAICRALLSRDPSDAEMQTFRKLLRTARSTAERNAVLQDVLWAYLNSNEFILIH